MTRRAIFMAMILSSLMRYLFLVRSHAANTHTISLANIKTLRRGNKLRTAYYKLMSIGHIHTLNQSLNRKFLQDNFFLPTFDARQVAFANARAHIHTHHQYYRAYGSDAIFACLTIFGATTGGAFVVCFGCCRCGFCLLVLLLLLLALPFFANAIMAHHILVIIFSLDLYLAGRWL